ALVPRGARTRGCAAAGTGARRSPTAAIPATLPIPGAPPGRLGRVPAPRRPGVDPWITRHQGGWHRRGGTASRRAWPEVTGPGSPPGIQGDLTDRPQVVPRVGKMAQHPGEGHVVVQPGVVGGEHLPDGFVGPPQARLDLVPPRLVHRADSPALGPVSGGVRLLVPPKRPV